jgi:hypothetical protein
MKRVVAIAGLVIVLVGCSNGDRSTKVGSPTTTEPRASLTAGEEYAACVATARTIEVAAAANYAKTGGYGTVADLVAAGYLKTAPQPSWGLVVGADGNVDDSTCR